jgi:hypothetical protein
MNQRILKYLLVRISEILIGTLTFIGIWSSGYFISASHVHAGEADKLYVPLGMSCSEGKPGQSGGPVTFSGSEIRIAGIECSISGKTSLNRMSGYLVDARCGQVRKGGFNTRIYISKNAGKNQLIIHSDKLGLIVLYGCPEPLSNLDIKK